MALLEMVHLESTMCVDKEQTQCLQFAFAFSCVSIIPTSQLHVPSYLSEQKARRQGQGKVNHRKTEPHNVLAGEV